MKLLLVILLAVVMFWLGGLWGVRDFKALNIDKTWEDGSFSGCYYDAPCGDN